MSIEITEEQLAEKYIYSTISAGISGTALSGTPIYPYKAGLKAVFPCIVFNMQSPGKDTTTLNQTRMHSNILYQVKAVGKDCTMAQIDPIAKKIDSLLQKTRNLSDTQGEIYACYRESPISYEEYDSGIDFLYRGGLYRILVHTS